ncbi:MAG: segregation/condensation protein A [Thermostichales cyanobacterium HHBFW_bins_127]
MNVTDAAIALLLQLAERGEIDPWDVQVIDVIDRFLSQLAPTASTRDLSESGQAFLYAAMLVYLKAMALGQAEAAPPPLPEPEPETCPGPLALDQVLRPRMVPHGQRTRPVTLRELIEQMQHLETLLKPPAPRPPRPSRQQALQAIRDLAHPENLSENLQQLATLLAPGSPTTFEALVHSFARGSPTISDRVQVFWGLLLMASRSQVDLEQGEFYGAITIHPVGGQLPVSA